MRSENFHAVAWLNNQKNAGLVPEAITAGEQTRLEKECLGQMPYSLHYAFNNPP